MQPAPPGRPFRRRMVGTLAQVAPIWNGSWRQLTTLMLVCGSPLVGTWVLYPASHWVIPILVTRLDIHFSSLSSSRF